MAINLHKKYSEVLDQGFRKGLYTDKLVNRDYNFTGAKTLEVTTIQSQELKSYDRTSTGDRFGGHNEVQDVVKSYTVTQDVGFKVAVDEGNFKDQSELKTAAVVTKVQMEERVYPAIDKNRLAVAATAVAANSQKVIFKPEDAYDNVLDMSTYLDEDEAPEEGRFLIVTPEFYKAVKKQIVTTTQAPATNDALLKKGFVGELDGIPVVKMPKSYFPVNYKAFMWHKKALLAAEKIKNTKVHKDSENVDGIVVTGRFYFDSFVLDAKKNSVTGVATS